jgi:hypothetical protein
MIKCNTIVSRDGTMLDSRWVRQRGRNCIEKSEKSEGQLRIKHQLSKAQGLLWSRRMLLKPSTGQVQYHQDSVFDTDELGIEL